MDALSYFFANFATMEFRTIVHIPRPAFELMPCERIIFVGSCFADSIGKRFQEEKFRAVINPSGVMYNPVSILHTVEKKISASHTKRGTRKKKKEQDLVSTNS